MGMANVAHARGPATGSLPFGLSAFFGNSSKAENTDRRTRVVIGLAQDTRFQIFSLNNPNRVIIELPQVDMRLPKLGRSSTRGLVENLTAGQSAPGRSRVVISVSEPVVVENAHVEVANYGKAARLVMDLIPFADTGKPAKAAFAKPTYSLGGPLAQPPVPQPAHAATGKKRTAAYRPLIVIDPGHGGKDSGARKFGLNEKDVVLSFGLTLRKRLLATRRYRVKMTRDRDIFVPLSERREFAEDNTAALFIAVHADYANAKARGATIYSLRKRVANQLRMAAAEEAAKEALSNREMKFVSASSGDLKAVRGILGDLAQREVHVTLERTNIFTQFAIRHMGATTTMRSEPHRQAAFSVLKTAKVPSVLIELAYVSNRQDAARLRSQRWRNEVSGSLVKAIDTYFAHALSQIPQ